MIVPVIVGIVLLGATLALPVWVGAVAAVVSLVVIALSATVLHASVQFVLGTSAGLLLGVLIGFSRRQFRVAEQRSREALAEQQRAALLADRSRAARDIHDVLAHSLGGLVLQLDAVEALLEAGRVDEATRRAGEARTLAADGLAEARRAVHALRDDTATGPEDDVEEPSRASRLGTLLDDHGPSAAPCTRRVTRCSPTSTRRTAPPWCRSAGRPSPTPAGTPPAAPWPCRWSGTAPPCPSR